MIMPRVTSRSGWFALFIIIKQINHLTAPRAVEKPGDPPPPEDIKLLREIRDALKDGKP